jgi:hypothetical protein
LTKYKLKLNAATIIIHVENNHCYSDNFFPNIFLKLRAEENCIIFFTCNVTKKYFVTLFISFNSFNSIFNFSLRFCVTLQNFVATLRFFRYVTFCVQISATLLDEVFFFSFGFRSSTEKVSKMLLFQAQIMICSIHVENNHQTIIKQSSNNRTCYTRRKQSLLQ